MASEAFAGVGTKFQRWDGAAWQDIAEVNSIDGPGMTKDVLEVTSLDTDAGYNEFITGFAEGGTLTLDMNFTRETYELMKEDFESDEVRSYRIQLPDYDSEPSTFTIEGLVIELPITMTADDKVTVDVVIQITSQVVYESGGISWSSYWATRSLFFLDGSIKTVGENKYFTDLSANGRDFLITGYDFSVSVGFPYKSAATISAPAGDAALIAADINNFLYASDGTPNQIPVISLFQDIDYEHKIFCQHSPQTLRSNGTELFEPRVLSIYMATDVLSGTELTTAQTYFSVPTEDTTTMVWLSPTGNDSTGDGSKATPYKTWSKIVSTDKANVYCKTGAYNLTGALTFSGASAVNIIGTGFCTNSMTSYTCTVNRAMTIKGFDITGTATYPYLPSVSLEFDNCRLTKSANNCMVVSQTGLTDAIFKDCILNISSNNGLIQDFTDYGNLTITGCAGVAYIYAATTRIKGLLTMKHNKLSGSYVNVWGFNTGLNVVDNAITNTGAAFAFRVAANADVTTKNFKYNTINGNLTSGVLVNIGTTNEGEVNGINELQFIGNKVTNDHTGGLAANTCHTVIISTGIDHTIKYNEITSDNGYGIVLKAGGEHYTTTDAHISYNIFKYTGGQCLNAICNRGSHGVIASNNTIIGFKGTAASDVFKCDADSSGDKDNSLLCINNLVTLGSNIRYLKNGDNITMRNNSFNLMGYTISDTIGENDSATTVTLSATGVPSVAVTGGEEVAGDNNIGLAGDYVIPSAITYETQGASWQRGAVLV
jgi:predicted secreted protein